MKFVFAEHVLDIDRRELRRSGKPIALEPQVFDLLVYLVQNRDRVVSKDDLLEAVWGGRIVSDSALTSRITAVRKAIGDNGAEQRLIRTVSRKGLRFVGAVREEEEPLRKLAAIFAADVEGYSRLMGQDEVGTLRRLTACRAVLDERIAAFRGRIFGSAGDSVIADFASAVDAVQCALAVQEALATEEQMRFRIGVHVGDVIVQGDNLFGDGVNIAARLEALAAPGGICISGAVRDQIGTKLPLVLADLGEQRVKNIAQPIRAYRVGDATASAVAALSAPLLDQASLTSSPVARVEPQTPGVPLKGTGEEPLHEEVAAPSKEIEKSKMPRLVASARLALGRRAIDPRHAATAVGFAAVIVAAIMIWWTQPHGRSPTAAVQPPVVTSSQTAPAAPRLSIVVLPFANLSDDPQLEYFAEGMTDDVTTDLSRISGSFVIARTTAFTYKGKPVDVKAIGRELGVRYVLEGSVRRAGERVEINVQLVDTESGAHVWADRFDTDNRNVAEAQSENTARLARTLNLKLVEDVARRIEQQPTTDLDAQNLVMLGEVSFRRWLRSTGRDQTQALQDAQRYFERALAEDPRLVDARVGIAKILVNNLLFGLSTSTKGDGARAEQLLLEAIETDPNRSEVYRYFGLLLRLQNRLIESRAAFEKALAIDRYNASARLQMGWTLLFLGEPEAGLAEGEEALRQRPHDPEMRGVYQQQAWCLLLLDRVQPAVEMLTNAIAERPRQWVNRFALAAALGLKGNLDGARAELGESLKLEPEVNSLARFRANRPWGNAQYWALFEQTATVGLRRAGFLDE